MKSLGILWAQYGPYHVARVEAMRRQAGTTAIHALELADQTSDYQWKRPSTANLVTLFPGSPAEQLSFQQVFRGLRRVLVDLRIEVCLLPSYAPLQSFAALMAAKSLGLRTVMMNESHAGTARARGPAAWMKRRLVKLFDAALVGGQPQKRYFSSLGLAENKIFTDYDSVDNDYFSRRSDEIRERRDETGIQYELPQRYFLSLGRFVAKKNLATLIRAYRIFLDSGRASQVHLVMVGSGIDHNKLISLCQELDLPAYDKTSMGAQNQKANVRQALPGVHFYGFRQIEENPIFYGLAEAFVLPSLWEEWGLVVNEAMASGLPVIVSETAGCAEDLLKPNSFKSTTNAGFEIRENGCVFNPSSSESLAQAFLELATAPDLREKMGRASRVIVDTFSCETFATNALLAGRAACGENIPVPRGASAPEPQLDVA